MSRPFKPLGLSVYLSTLESQKQQLAAPAPGTLVFTSLHISEEFSDGYTESAAAACRWLAGRGYRILADVSKKTLTQFGETDMIRLAKRLKLWGLRIDYGFEEAEIAALAKELPVALNASTIDVQTALRIKQAGGELIAMHNYYPRPETGLSSAFYKASTAALQVSGIPVYAFVAGNGVKRGPLFEGLPTLERHRGEKPLAAMADLIANLGVDAVFVGDGVPEPEEYARMAGYATTGVLPVPALLHKGFESLYGKVFTSRPDSPGGAVRFMESREYSCFGAHIEALPAMPRPTGCITLDNHLYGRYSGEVQLLRRERAADPRVNVIGHIHPAYSRLTGCIPNGSCFSLVHP